MLGQLQETTGRIRAEANTRHLTVTTTGGFASLWLIPRLARFTALHPDVDVRIQATYVSVPLERGAADVAVRYARHDSVAAEGVRLFGEEVTLVCAPSLLAGPRRLSALKDLSQHTLLHLDTAHGILDWDTWLTAEGLGNLKPAASLRFDNYEQLIQAARMGQGVALGIKRLVEQLITNGELVVPFGQSMASHRSYYVLRAPATRPQPHVEAFVGWLKSEADACLAADTEAKPRPRGGSRNARKTAEPRSAADDQRRGHAAEGGKNAERRDPARTRILE